MAPSEEARPRRGLGLADIFILFAATALSLWWLQAPLERRLTFVRDGRIIENLRPATLVGAAFAATWGVAVVAIRLRSKKLSGPDWSKRPGFIACSAATAAVLIKLVPLLTWGVVNNFRMDRWYVPTILGQLIEPAAIGVLVGWLTLYLASHWRRDRTLSDDLGIAVGVAWLALYLFGWIALSFDW